MRLLLFVFVVLLSAPLVFADAQDEKFAALPPGTPVIGSRGTDEFRLSGTGGRLESVEVSGQPFTRAARVTTLARPETPYQFQISTGNTAPVKKGDILLAVFWVRAVVQQPASAEARTEFCFELGREPYSKMAVRPTDLTTQWQKIYVPFVSTLDLAAGQAGIHFRAGYDPQTIEIGGVRVIDYGTGVKYGDLPVTAQSYAGRDAAAPWRKAAADRIEQNRKGDLTVVVLDANRKPVPGARVTVRMKRHAYGFGSAVDARQLLASGPDAEKYRAVIVQNFNKVVIENHLKWILWEHDRDTGPRAVTWLREHGIEVRGHCLVWPAKKDMPRSIVELYAKPEALRKAVTDHIADELGALRGQCVEWDVMNEPFSNHEIQNVLAGLDPKGPRIEAAAGAAFIAEWFKAARAADPLAKLDINDYSILSTGGTDFAHQDYYERTIRSLIERGAPVQGIGMQSHFGAELTPIPRLLEVLDRFAKLGLPIQSTEHDIDNWDEQIAADYTRDFMTAFFSHPATIGIITWGFWEKAHWIPSAAYYRKDWTLRPVGEVWRDLVFKQWWTNADGLTDASGIFKTRGFLGDYEIGVEIGGAKKVAPAKLGKVGTRVEIVAGR